MIDGATSIEIFQVVGEAYADGVEEIARNILLAAKDRPDQSPEEYIAAGITTGIELTLILLGCPEAGVNILGKGMAKKLGEAMKELRGE